MDKKNKLRLTIISFLTYGLTGALVIITGIVLSNIANYFNLPVSKMSKIFTFLNSGILISIFFNVWLMEIISLKKQINVGFLLIILSIIGLILSHNINIFSFSMFLLGIVSGISISIGTNLITYLYDGKKRASILLITDSFFSVSGIIFPILAGIMLSHNIMWYWVYVCINMLYFLIFIISLFSYFPNFKKTYFIKNENNNLKIKEYWGINVLLMSLAAFLYILGQLSFISWIPRYTNIYFNMNIKNSSKLISNFWIFYMIGMWFFSIILNYFDLQFIVTILSCISSILIYLFIHTINPNMLFYYLSALGFFSSAIYTSIITLGTQQTKLVSSKLTNFILTCGTIGTMLTFIITGPIVDRYGIITALKISNILYLEVFIICFLFKFFKNKKY